MAASALGHPRREAPVFDRGRASGPRRTTGADEPTPAVARRARGGDFGGDSKLGGKILEEALRCRAGRERRVSQPRAPYSPGLGARQRRFFPPGRWTDALHRLQSARQARAEPDLAAPVELMSACPGDVWFQVLDMLAGTWLEGLEPDLHVQNSAIACCGRGDEWTRAVRLLERATYRSYEPDIVSCSSAMRPASWPSALGLLSRARAARLEPNCRACGSAMNACSSGDGWEKSVSMLFRMPHAQLMPDASVRMASIEVADWPGGWRRALGLLLPPPRVGSSFEGDWTCPACGYLNFGSRKSVRCFVCGCFMDGSRRGQLSNRQLMEGVEAFVQRWRVPEKAREELRSSPSEVIAAVLREFRPPRRDQKLRPDDVNDLLMNFIHVINKKMLRQARKGEADRAQLDSREGAAAVLRKAGIWQRAFDFLSAGQRELRREDVNAAIFATGGNWVQALAFLADMDRRQLERDVLSVSAAIGACAQSGAWQPALSLLREAWVSQIAPNFVTYTNVLTACKNSGMWRLALELLAEMVPSGVTREASTFNQVIGACANEHGWEHALWLQEEMRDEGIEPNIISHTLCIAACEAGRAWRHAFRLLLEMREQAHEPNALHLLSVLNSVARASSWEDDGPEAGGGAFKLRGLSKQARALLESMRADGSRLDLRHYNNVLHACKPWSDAASFLQVMRQQSLEPDLVSGVTLLYSYGVQDLRWASSMHILARMSSQGIQQGVVSRHGAMIALARVGKWADTLLLLAQARCKSLQQDNLALMNAALSSFKDVETWRRSVNLLAAGGGGYGTPLGALEPLSVLSHLGDQWEIALGTLKEVTSTSAWQPSATSRAFNVASKVCERARQWQRSVFLVEGQHEIAAGSDSAGYATAISAWLTAISEEKEQRRQQQQQQLQLRQQQTPTRSPSVAPLPTVTSWPPILREASYTVIQDVAEDSMNVVGSDPMEWQMALSHLDDMQQMSMLPGSDAYALAIQACDIGMQWECAIWLLADMRIASIPPSRQAYGAALSACDRCGQAVKAIRLLDDMMQHQVEPDMLTYSLAIGSAKGALRDMRLEVKRRSPRSKPRGSRML